MRGKEENSSDFCTIDLIFSSLATLASGFPGLFDAQCVPAARAALRRTHTKSGQSRRFPVKMLALLLPFASRDTLDCLIHVEVIYAYFNSAIQA